MGPRPQTSIPIAADLLKQFEDVGTASRAARKELSAVKRELKRTIKSGQQASPELVRRLHQAEKLNTELGALKTHHKTLRDNEEATRAAGRGLRWMIKAQAMRQIASGQVLDPGAISGMIWGASEHAQFWASRRWGQNSRQARFARGFAAVAPAAGEATIAVVQAVKQVLKENRDLGVLGAQFARGAMSQMEYDILQKLTKEAGKDVFFGANPIEEFSTISKLAKEMSKMSGDKETKILDRVIRRNYKDVREGIGSYFRNPTQVAQDETALLYLKSSSIKPRLDEIIKQHEKNLGYKLDKKQKQEIRRRFYFEQLAKMRSGLRKDLLKDVQDANAKNIKTVKDLLAETAARKLRQQSQAYWEAEKAHQEEIQNQRMRSRVALTGRIGD